MPKKSEFLPPPKPDSHPEEAAILTRIFKKEPLITYRELLDKYKSEVSKQQGLLGLLGLFTTYLDRPNDDPLTPQLIQAKQAALQMEMCIRDRTYTHYVLFQYIPFIAYAIFTPLSTYQRIFTALSPAIFRFLGNFRPFRCV